MSDSFQPKALLSTWGLALCLLSPALLGTAHAADDKKAARAQAEKMQKLQQSQMQLQQEKTQLASEKSDLEKQLAAAKAELRKLRDQTAKTQTESREAGVELATRETELKQVREQMAESTEQASRLLQQTRAELKQRGDALRSCEVKNEGLYKLNTDLLKRFEKAASSSAGWLNGGSLTKFSLVDLENEVQQLGDELKSLRLASAKR